MAQGFEEIISSRNTKRDPMRCEYCAGSKEYLGKDGIAVPCGFCDDIKTEPVQANCPDCGTEQDRVLDQPTFVETPSTNPVMFVADGTLDWLNQIGAMLSAKMQLTFRTDSDSDFYNPLYSAKAVKALQLEAIRAALDYVENKCDDYHYDIISNINPEQILNIIGEQK